MRRSRVIVAFVLVFVLLAAACGTGSAGPSRPLEPSPPGPFEARPLECGPSASCIAGFSIGDRVYGIDCGRLRSKFVSDETYVAAVDLRFEEVRQVIGADPSLFLAVPASGVPGCSTAHNSGAWFGAFIRINPNDRSAEVDAQIDAIICQFLEDRPLDC